MFEFFTLLWNIAFTAVSESIMESDLSLLIYLSIIALVFCYFANLVRSLRRF